MKAGRANQRTRTRSALLAAAVDLVREGRAPSMPEAAERALVSTATAYRYFPTAEDLWEEASDELVDFLTARSEVEQAIEAAGSDPADRLDALVRTMGWRMLEHQIPFRRMAKAALERWFAQQGLPEANRVPVREGRRNRYTRLALAPLVGVLDDLELERLVAALGVAWGTEATIALVDVGRLDVDAAKAVMLQTTRWVLAGALADAQRDRNVPS